MNKRAQAAIDKVAVKRGIPREVVIGAFARAREEESARAERQRIERETREAEAHTKPYDSRAELRQIQADGELLLREIEARHAPVPTIKFRYADGTPAEWTHDELLEIRQAILDDLLTGKSLDPSRDRDKLEDANRLAREHGLLEVHA